MEVSYKRNLNRNFMIIQYEPKDEYEIKMVCMNKIKGLLDVHVNFFNGSCDLYYDISSRQPINRLYERKEMEYEDIRLLLQSVKIILEEAKKYLLDISNVFFSPEYGYCNPENQRTEWIFYPGEDNDGLRELAEYIIERVNHSDSMAVDMAYGFFKIVKAEMLSVTEIERILDSCSEKTRMKINEEMPINTEQSPIETLPLPDIEAKTVQKDNFKEKVKTKIREVIQSKLTGVKQDNVLAKYENRKMEWETYGLEERENYSGETVVMGIGISKAERRLRSLNKGDREYISLRKLPCVFGKLENCADIVLKDSSVSRMHARIFEEEGELYLQDLNSTNGSYINNLALESNETVKLKVGDEIAFGNVRYIYE